MAEKDYDSRMHTAEHILNSVMDKKYGCGRSFRSHIEKKKSKCDYNFKNSLSLPEIRDIGSAVNAIILQDITVTEEFVTRGEADSLYFTGKLPADAGDRIRIVKIGDYDGCPCIGPHVGKTSEIGRFIITTSDYKDGILRLRYKLEE
jgi:Ser-tRNA(Ala) deacylase AlaX